MVELISPQTILCPFLRNKTSRIVKMRKSTQVMIVRNAQEPIPRAKFHTEIISHSTQISSSLQYLLTMSRQYFKMVMNCVTLFSLSEHTHE